MIGSMSRTGNCWDNAPIESFWGRMKVEWIEGLYKTRKEAEHDLIDYIWGYYNTCRLHSTNGYKTPVEAYNSSPAASKTDQHIPAGKDNFRDDYR